MNSLRYFSIFFLVCNLASCSPKSSINDADHIFKPLVGKEVHAEGIAWGASSKGLGERIILASGYKVYLEGEKYLKKHPNGKIVRIIGELQIRTMKPVRTDTKEVAQGFTSEFKYYVLKVKSFKVISEIKKAFLYETTK